MTNKHIKVFRIITSFTREETLEAFKKFSPFEIEIMTNLIDDCGDRYEFQYDGNVCHWENGEQEYDIFFVTESNIRELEKWDNIIHEGLEGHTKIDDITEDVLYDRIDTSVFGFFEFEMKVKFYDYRVENLTKDDILDKILKYGKESLTENDKLFMDDKEMISPLDNL
jgi:hypothetical protein